MIDILGFARDVQSCRKFRALTVKTIRTFAPLGVKRLSYHHVPPWGSEDRTNSLTVLSYGFPVTWLDRYKNRQYSTLDPVPRRALHLGKAFYWSEAANDPDATAEERAYFADVDTAAIGDGLAVPVFGPHGRNGYVGMGSGQAVRGFSPDTELALQVMAQVAHLRFCALLAAEAGEPITLSSREHDVLVWMSQGKSNAVIADILTVSPNTVDTYVRRIFKKLGVADRVTASLRGMALGLLD
ncbi:MAG: LuxR family transcriptional regulator [Pseudomonadota bacterium]